MQTVGGFARLTVYTAAGEGWGEKNIALMAHALWLVSGLSCPWMLAEDFNMEPPQLEDSLALRSTALCEVAATSEPGGTCGNGWSASTIDYAVASRSLACGTTILTAPTGQSNHAVHEATSLV